MMDEQLIDEVAQHGVIYNRQKYYLNGSAGGGCAGGSGKGQYETKDEAWQTIAMKLRTDVETCKKRWKYLRERYVSQRKQGDPPVYEHLSRPYLEKMKFLDQHIQPRKSYRNVPNFLTSPHSANSSNYSEFDSKSNGSMKNMSHFGSGSTTTHHHYHQQDQQQHTMHTLSSAAAAASVLENVNGQVKIEADQVFRDFAAAVASQQLQHISQSQMHHTAQNYQEHYRDNCMGNTGIGGGGGADSGGAVASSVQNDGVADVASSSSSMTSPLSSPISGVNGTHNGTGHSTSNSQQTTVHNTSNHMPIHGFNGINMNDLDAVNDRNFNMKKPRVQLSTHQGNIPHNDGNGTSHSSIVNNNNINATPLKAAPMTSESAGVAHQDREIDESASSTCTYMSGMQRHDSTTNTQPQQQALCPSNVDFLFQLYQQMAQQQQTSSQQLNFGKFQSPQNPPQRCSELLLGELVTTELLKMPSERRKTAQRKILEILFFDDSDYGSGDKADGQRSNCKCTPEN